MSPCLCMSVAMGAGQGRVDTQEVLWVLTCWVGGPEAGAC